MNRKFWIIFGSVHLVIVAVFLVVYFWLLAPANPQTVAPDSEAATPQPRTQGKSTELDQQSSPQPEPTVEIILDLEFENPDDLNSVWLGSYDGRWEDHDPAEAVSGGLLRLGAGNPFLSLSVSGDFTPGQFMHIRTRAGEKTCYSVGVQIWLDSQSKGIELGDCTVGDYQASTVFNRDNYGDSIFGRLPLSGSVPALTDEWVDRILWLNEDGDKIYYVVFNTDDQEHIMVGAAELLDDWKYPNWHVSVNGYLEMDENGYTPRHVDIDLIRVGSGSLLDYLEEYVPIYQDHQQELETLMSEEPALMSELHPQGWEEQSEEQVGQAQDMTEHPSESNFGVLTWPDPEPILPYLITLDNIDRCNNCENQVHGVILTPNGYSFMVAYGNPEDSGPPGENSRVKHWVKLYSETADLDEILFIAKISNYRIPPFNAGEPAQLISGTSAATNLLLTKANVVMMTHVDNAGKNARIARNILDATIPLVPEDGLATPELVPEPSVAFNAQKADEVLERAWMGSFENWQNETDSFSGRSAMWVRLKAPAEKVEVAVYHSQSQTYLSYFWMDNPQVGVDLWMMPENPDGYYFGHYEGEEFVVRVWVDGELVAEFPVRK